MSWQGRLLRIDLNRGTCETEPLREDWRDAYIGQRGLATKYLWEAGAARMDPLAPEMPLIFATGPLTGTSAATGGRYSVITKGALTGAVACSNSGGYFGAALKFAGWDMIIVTGRAETPVYLWIDDGEAELLPADGFIWGESFWDTETALKERHGKDVRVAGIGRAGEALVRYACIMNDRDRAAGRSGVGAVMGAKRLKAIVVRGTGGVKVHDPARFAELVMEGHAMLAASPGRQSLTTYGTNAMMSKTGSFGSLPTRNCLDTTFEHYEDISAEAMRRSPGPGRQPNLITNKACFACTIGCGRVAKIQPDHFTATKGERYRLPQGGLEYESAYALGAMVGVGDLDAATFANMVCNEDGMDPISFGATLSAAMELFEKGVIGTDQTGGIELTFGNAEALAEMALKTATAEGFGADLALGAQRLCEKYGHPELAMTVKGQEFPGYDPRAMQGMGLAYATSPRGACHMRADPYQSDFTSADPSVKAPIVKRTQDEEAALDSLGICAFTTSAWDHGYMARLLDAACGGGWTLKRMLEAGERIWTLERLFNLEAGFTTDDDTLPRRMFEMPAPSGTFAGEVNHLDVMLPAYYALRGWTEDGRPTDDLLARLGMSGDGSAE